MYYYYFSSYYCFCYFFLHIWQHICDNPMLTDDIDLFSNTNVSFYLSLLLAAALFPQANGGLIRIWVVSRDNHPG